MRKQQKLRNEFLQELCILEKKIGELKELVGKNPNEVWLEDLVKRTKDTFRNCEKKIEPIGKMASKERR